MVVRYIAPNGSRMMGPPYTEEEEQDFYRRMDGGPWTVLRSAKAPQTAEPGAAATNRQNQATTPPTPAAVAPPEDPQSE
jgi:hypothetical protein